MPILKLLLNDVRGEQLKQLDPADAARLLGHYGITVLPSEGFVTADEAVAAADRLGWPVALKTTDPDAAAQAGPGRRAAGHPGRRSPCG